MPCLSCRIQLREKRQSETPMRNFHRSLILLLCIWGMTLGHMSAVEQIVSGTISFNNSAPTIANIPNWNTGWGGLGITGWNYIGRINGSNSAVYLGNNWVITAGHVGTGTFMLDGTSYDEAPGTAQEIVTATGTADITLFQIVTAPPLPPLIIGTSTPSALSASGSGDQVVMLGNGGGESWGLSTVTAVNVPQQIQGSTDVTTDFETAYGTTTISTYSARNYSVFDLGDSGGGDFIYNSATGLWMLDGLDEKIDDYNDSFMVELSAYSSQIDAIVDVPEPGSYLIGGLALISLVRFRKDFSRRPAEAAGSNKVHLASHHREISRRNRPVD